MGFFDFGMKNEESNQSMEEPGKRNVVSLLKEDHEKVKGLFKQFEESEDKKELAGLLNSIIEELSVHATVEEKLVYPLIEQDDKEKAAEANEEHHVVRLILAELSGYEGSEEIVKTKVKVLSELVKHHIEEEEGELLPMLEASGEDLEQLGMEVTQAKEKMKKSKSSMPKKSHRSMRTAAARGRARGGTGRSTAKAAAAKKKTSAKRKSSKSATSTKSRGTTRLKAAAKKRSTTSAKSTRSGSKAKAAAGSKAKAAGGGKAKAAGGGKAKAAGGGKAKAAGAGRSKGRSTTKARGRGR